MINNKLNKIKILAFKIRRINEKIENLRYEIEYHTSIYSEFPKNFGYNNNICRWFVFEPAIKPFVQKNILYGRTLPSCALYHIWIFM